MNGPRMVVLELSRLEASQLANLVTQFAELLDDSRSTDDPAIGRLVPDAYPDDPAAAREFRDLTEQELLHRRAADAATVIASLRDASALPGGDDSDADLTEIAIVPLDREEVGAWLRTLAAVRLILASRLGIEDEDDHDDDDPRYGVYEWLGYRLDGLVRAVETDS